MAQTKFVLTICIRVVNLVSNLLKDFLEAEPLLIVIWLTFTVYCVSGAMLRILHSSSLNFTSTLGSVVNPFRRGTNHPLHHCMILYVLLLQFSFR